VSNYRRLYVPGGTYFFTVVTYRRRPIFDDPVRVDVLRDAFRYTRRRRPFRVVAVVVLPDHLHCIWVLPKEDEDFSIRWQILKTRFTRVAARDRSGIQIWQPRFWEHLIRDPADLRRHLDYIHFNPVHHGYCKRPIDWRYGSFGRFVRLGLYPPDWGAEGASPDVGWAVE